MSDRPIIFSGPMVRALLAGRKTQTRRLATSPLRYTKPGDRLYVRESGNWQTMTEVAPNAGQKRGAVWYAADGDPSGLSFFGGKMRPSIHMPRWASRLTLGVTRLRLEPLQSISGHDAEAEGIFQHIAPHSIDKVFRSERASVAVQRYRELWIQLHGAASWDENPEVLVIEFEVLHGNLDRLAA